MNAVLWLYCGLNNPLSGPPSWLRDNSLTSEAYSWVKLFAVSRMVSNLYLDRGKAQVFRSGNLLLHQPSNSHYCVSLRQQAVALTTVVRATTSLAETGGAWWIFLFWLLPWPQQPAGWKLVAPVGYFYYQVYSALLLQFLDWYWSTASKTDNFVSNPGKCVQEIIIDGWLWRNIDHPVCNILYLD